MANGHIRIPDELLARTDLTPLHKVILGTLGRLQGTGESCAPSVGYISEKIGMSERVVQYALRDLVAKKEISIKRRVHNTNIYTVAWTRYRNLRAVWASEKQHSARVQNLDAKGAKIAHRYTGELVS